MTKDTDSVIPNDIALWRKRMGMHQDEFAERLEVPRSRLSLWDQGRTLPNWENFLKIQELTGCLSHQLYRNPEVLTLIAQSADLSD